MLAPVEGVWARLERGGARARVIAAVRSQLAAVAGVAGTAAAGEILASRLMRRLAEQGGPAQVADPVGWLLVRGLPRRPGCADARCDEGIRLDTGGSCDSCAFLIADRRALRHAVAAAIDAELPAATTQEWRAEYEQRLRQQVAADAECAAIRRKRTAAEQAALAQARAEAAAAERARQAQPCADCGAPGSASLCETCGHRRATEAVIREAARTAAAAWADPASQADADTVAAHAEAGMRSDLDQTCAQARAQGATEHTLAVLGRVTAETTAAEYRRSALALLARTAEADTEARQAYEARMRSWHRYATRTAAQAAAAEAAGQARARTAEHLLATRLGALRDSRPADLAPDDPAPDRYAAGAARVRAALRTARARA
ncbi:hypothetical protein [Streptomyces sp. 7N604]|uniref:hypothetical protein n=1 Tax=Streptomyces sp. 7N604 TaxID=3457415 RepID=UPI003FCF9893